MPRGTADPTLQPRTALKIAMLTKGVTTKELARRAGIAATELSGIRSGRINPTLDRKRKIAVALGMPIADLFPDDASNRVAS